MYWYEDEVKRLENDRAKLEYDAETIFYGSSSIRLWTNLYSDFGSLKPVNLGFGGSTLAACVWFFERIMAPYNPKRLIIYAGDNDLGDGRHPEEVFIFFQQLVVKAQKQFGDIPCYFVSLKLSPSRWSIADKYKYTNNLIKTEIAKYDSNWQFIDVFEKMIDAGGRPKSEYYVNDGLHLSEKAYQLWKEVISDKLAGNH
ncbi:MAG TPA: GDSL-type esterase/lipase family protein [Mucilaginibacter sp.]|jgi:lysophospholipase L1-like esterase